MRAIVLSKLGGPEELEYREVADPEPAKGEVLVKVKAEGVCGRDLIDRRGGYRGLPLPVILGHEFAGEVVSAPADSGFVPGDRVANLLRLGCGKCHTCARGEAVICEKGWQSYGQTRSGGYAELVTATPATLVKVPSAISDVEAASAACTFGTALRALRTVGRITLGDDLLITGASGGVGIAAIQIAKALGARVIAQTSSEAKREAIAAAGADDIVVDAQQSLHDKVRAIVPYGVDAVLELTGSPTFTSSMRSLRNGGKLILVGNILADSIKVNPGAVILFGYQLLGSAGCTAPDLEDVFTLIAEKKLRVVIHRTLPLREAAEAHKILAERGAVGRVVLTM